MEYNTKEIYFGKPTFNTGDDGYYKTAIQAFVKQGDKFLTIKEFKIGKQLLLKKFSDNPNDYLTVSELCPITVEMKGKQIPETISEGMIELYLLKHKIKDTFKYKHISDDQKTR